MSDRALLNGSVGMQVTAPVFALAFLVALWAPVDPSEAGDFGRPRKSFLFANPLASWMTDHPKPPIASLLTMTVEEEQMRDTAFRLRVHVFNNQAIGADPYAVQSYANYLTRQGYVFGLSRMARIDEEILADQEALERFALAAQKVLFADSQRQAALRQPRLQAPHFIRRDTKNRIQENCAFIESTFADIGVRLAAYREAIDRTVLETPPAGTDVIDSSLIAFGERATMWRRELLRPCGVEEAVLHRDWRPYK